MHPEDVASALFTVTDDLVSTFPAQAARQMGWGLVPMMCAREIPVPGSLRRVIRVLVHWNTELKQNEVTHVYLRDAVKLRPDLVAAQ
jgi:chorismate mutase